MFKNYWSSLKRNSHLWLVGLGTLVWSLTMIKSGLVYRFGMGFWGPNGHDGIWHVSLIQSLARGSLQIPVFAGESLRNYHFGFDLLLAVVHVVTRIPVRLLYFQLTPPLLAVLIGVYLYKFLLAWTKDRSVGLWGLFFLYFGGSYGWLISLITGAGLGGESMFWAQQSISTLLNPPFALSLLILFFVLYRIVTLPQQPKTSILVILGLLIGSLAFIKIYAALLFLPGLALASLKATKLRKLVLFSVLFSLLFYFPFNRGASSLIVWQPFWFLENMVGLSDRFFWPRLSSAMLAYKVSRNFIKFIPAYGLATAIFIVGNFGVRLVGFFHLKNIKAWDPVTFLLSAMAALGFLVPMFVLQQGTPWNTIQFFYYSQFIFGIFAAKTLAGTKSIFISLVCVLATLPTTLDTLRHYLPSQPPAKISKEELSALNFLATRSGGIVFTPPATPNQYAPAPRPLYLYESTAYVSAFSGHPVYVEDTVNLNITGYPWRDRIDLANNFISTTDLSAAINFIDQADIRFIYLPEVAKTRPAFSAAELGGSVVYENSQSAVWEFP